MIVTKHIPSLCKNINVIPLKLQPRDISKEVKERLMHVRKVEKIVQTSTLFIV
jgi:hypothetical protein